MLEPLVLANVQRAFSKQVLVHFCGLVVHKLMAEYYVTAQMQNITDKLNLDYISYCFQNHSCFAVIRHKTFNKKGKTILQFFCSHDISSSGTCTAEALLSFYNHHFFVASIEFISDPPSQWHMVRRAEENC